MHVERALHRRKSSPQVRWLQICIVARKKRRQGQLRALALTPQLTAKDPTSALAGPQGSAYFCFVGLRWQCHCTRAPGWFVCSDRTNHYCQTQTSCKSHSVPWQIKHYHPLHANHKWECIISGWFVALIGCSRAKRFQDVSEHKAAALVIFQQVDWKRLPFSDEKSWSLKWLWIF